MNLITSPYPVPDILKEAFWKAHKIFPEGGICLEFGVGRGGSYLWMVEQIVKKSLSSKLIGFDSWQGLPEETAGVWFPERHGRGVFSYSKGCVMEKLSSMGIKGDDSRFSFVDGFFSKSLTNEVQSSIFDLIFVNIDVDIYKSSLEVLNFIKPLLREGVVIYWDDWKDPIDKYEGEWGEHLAWKQWSEANPDVIVVEAQVNELNQRYMIVKEKL